MTTPYHRRFAFAVLAAVAIAIGAQPAPAQDRSDIQRMIIEEARNSRVPPALALALAKVESNFQPQAVSSAGARGVMQIMPKTARDVFGVHENELWDARLNIQLGLDYLDQLYHQYGRRWDLALSHYNGGTLAGGPGARAMPHAFTRKYVADVLTWQRRYSEQAAVWQTAKLDDSGYAPARTRPDTRALDSIWTVADGPAADRPWRKNAGKPARDERPWLRDDRAPSDHDWASIEQRRRHLRPTLDDFASVVTWIKG